WMRKHNVQQFLSPAELAFVEDEKPSEESRVAFSWRAEAIVSLLWALKALPEMPPLDEPFEMFDVEAVQAALQETIAFVSKAQLRSAQEISEMENSLYHQHWRVRDAQFVGIGKFLAPKPGELPLEELNPDIVYERRYSLSWLVGWGDDWDNVPTDT